ncbi:hypothetical protein ASPSYDRAFT_738079 [Aspergillus sydowii CBS 593.65]|uniref:Secreted protein n=1 Tax=Aspergillus sydowii CBS 593.65 TaxID=1036612 RepID=A0A1L9TM85_9EURO|nr:uncharacterized protein ASPSYDRAFT_738079 [Aspergillus sydowii CBS 593.65]OJJ60528.1 hypothetical protein ASPSYDRAFT_738079 [Aspergillus sydowii CBS 593.65]
MRQRLALFCTAAFCGASTLPLISAHLCPLGAIRISSTILISPTQGSPASLDHLIPYYPYHLTIALPLHNSRFVSVKSPRCTLLLRTTLSCFLLSAVSPVDLDTI